MPVKPGYLTTEFYLTLLTGLSPLLSMVFHRDVSSSLQGWAAAAAGIATATYALSRSLVKRSASSLSSQTKTPS